MRFWTFDECRNWAAGDVRLDAKGCPLRPDVELHHTCLDIPPSFTRLNWFCRFLEQSLQPHQGCLLWVTDWAIFDENLHLYYRLRQSYGDLRLLNEAPGHYFLPHEGADLASFLEVAILCGWDAHLLTHGGYSRAFVSHDEIVEYASDDANPDLVATFAEALSNTKETPPA